MLPGNREPSLRYPGNVFISFIAYIRLGSIASESSELFA